MKRLVRPKAPEHFASTDPTASARLRRWYSASQHKHWNDTVDGKQPVREAVRSMSQDRCAWCEAPLGAGLKVEHYLPRESFAALRFCWENLLPACETCNTAKGTFCPPALSSTTLIDPVLEGVLRGEVYAPTRLLPTIAERLVEPTVDDPSEHLRFQPADCTWQEHTPTGRKTIEKLFSDPSRNLDLQKLSDLVRRLIVDGVSDETLRKYGDLHGHETVFNALVSYWKGFFPRTNP